MDALARPLALVAALVVAACSGGARPGSGDPQPPIADMGADGSSGGGTDGESEGAPLAGRLVIQDAALIGQRGLVDLVVHDGRIEAITAPDPAHAGADVVIDADGGVVVAAAIDSHVHLLYREEAAAMAAGGVAVAVDLAAPLAIFDERKAGAFAPLRLLAAGPMLAAPGGYPTQGWGAGGFGLECADTAAAVAAVDMLADRGAEVIKVSLEIGPRLSEASLTAVVERAHARGLKVAAHALGDADAATAAALGVDLLAHVPLEPLAEATLAALADRAVVTSLHAFGAGGAAIANLKALRGRGATILYGTDFGNTSVAGIDAVEIGAMEQAGMDGRAILAAMSEAPAKFWGIEGGSVVAAAPASLLILRADPQDDPLALADPRVVILGGQVVAGR